MSTGLAIGVGVIVGSVVGMIVNRLLAPLLPEKPTLLTIIIYILALGLLVPVAVWANGQAKGETGPTVIS